MDKLREEFEFTGVGINQHSITSGNILTEKETGRVVAVFYNDYDIESCVEQMQAARTSEWVSVDTLPENCQPVYVEEPQCYRFHHYKPISQQYKKGIKGRWQKFDGYGWNNCEAPARYKLEGPSDE